jgi:hypothetical protein
MTKKITIIIAAALFAINTFAIGMGEHPEKYCARMKDGKKVVMHRGEVITSEATLKNGTKIKPDGTVTMSDGSTMTLKDGECIDKDGGMMMEKKKTN